MEIHFSDKNLLSRLKWACIRGMLELDILLSQYLNEKYHLWSEDDKKSFIKLISYSDPELFSWLMGSLKPDQPHIKKMVEAIRQHAQSRI